jgi:hypothetical protein
MRWQKVRSLKFYWTIQIIVSVGIFLSKENFPQHNKLSRTANPSLWKCLEQFEQSCAHILTATHKGNCRHIVTLAPLGAWLSDEKIFKNSGTPGEIWTKITTHITYNPQRKL